MEKQLKQTIPLMVKIIKNQLHFISDYNIQKGSTIRKVT